MPSVYPAPELRTVLLTGDAALLEGRLDAAADAFKTALMLNPKEPHTRAEIYAKLGEIKRVQGRPREAAATFEKALREEPGHMGALRSLTELAREAGDFARAAGFLRGLLDRLTVPAMRVRALLELGEILDAKLHDIGGALTALETARMMLPDDPEIARRLLPLHERAGNWGDVAGLLEVVGDAEQDPKTRAELRFAEADVRLGRLREEARGIALLEAALSDDAGHEKGLFALEAIRSRRREWPELARLHGTLIAEHAARGNVERAWESCKKLGALRRSQLADGDGAIDAYRGALKCKPSDAESRAALADLLAQKGDYEAAVSELELLLDGDPKLPATYAKLSSVRSKQGDADAAWRAVVVLDELGAADVDQHLCVLQHRTDAPLRPSARFDDGAWELLAQGSSGDPLVSALLRAVGPAAVACKISELKEKKKLVALPRSARLEATSTVSAVRTAAWAAHLLGIELPALYKVDDVPGGLAVLQCAAPSAALGPEVLQGISRQELAFAVGRHLTLYRPELYPLVFFPTLDELGVLFVAALAIAMPDAPFSSRLSGPPERLRLDLPAHLDGNTRKALANAAAALDERDGKADLASFLRASEKLACRVGLLLAGDLVAVRKRIASESREVGGMTAEERERDLLAFFASTAHGKLRARLGATLHA